MRLRYVLATLFIGSTIVAAQPDAPPEDPYPPEAPPEPAPTPTEPAPAPVVTAPPGVVPPITINITNNNTGNNSNTNTQTNTAPVTVSTPVDVSTTTSTPVTVSTPVTTTTTTTVAPIAPPGLVDTNRGRHPTIERVALIAPPAKAPRWLAIGVTGGEEGPGIRAQVDLLRRGRFSLGIAANASGHGHGHHGHHDEGGDGRDGTASAVVFVAYTKQIGRLQMRAQVGVGAQWNKDRDNDLDHDTIARTVGGGDDDGDENEREHHGSPRAEAALLVALPLTKRLGLVAGPIVSATRSDTDDRMFDKEHHERPEVDARFMAGIRLGF